MLARCGAEFMNARCREATSSPTPTFSPMYFQPLTCEVSRGLWASVPDDAIDRAHDAATEASLELVLSAGWPALRREALMLETKLPASEAWAGGATASEPTPLTRSASKSRSRAERGMRATMV